MKDIATADIIWPEGGSESEVAADHVQIVTWICDDPSCPNFIRRAFFFLCLNMYDRVANWHIEQVRESAGEDTDRVAALGVFLNHTLPGLVANLCGTGVAGMSLETFADTCGYKYLEVVGVPDA